MLECQREGERESSAYGCPTSLGGLEPPLTVPVGSLL